MPDEAVKLHQAARDIAPDSAWPLLQAQRDRAERLLNGVRAAVLVLLTLAALAYASRLPAHVTVANIVVLAPMIAWTVSQYLLFYARPALPAWVMVANPIADITAVTMIIAAYGIAESPTLALKSPILLAYFVIRAAGVDPRRRRQALAARGGRWDRHLRDAVARASGHQLLPGSAQSRATGSA